MDTRVCPGCMGSGEQMELSVFAGPDNAAYDLVSCSTCHGLGQVPLEPVRRRVAPAPKYPRGKNPAILAAIAAIEKHFPKTKKR